MSPETRAAKKQASQIRAQIKELTRRRADELAGTFAPTGMVACAGIGSPGHPVKPCEYCGVRFDRQHSAGELAAQIRELEFCLPGRQPAQMELWS